MPNPADSAFSQSKGGEKRIVMGLFVSAKMARRGSGPSGFAIAAYTKKREYPFVPMRERGSNPSMFSYTEN